MTTEKTLLYIIVNYFNETEVRDFVIHQLAGQVINNMKIIIVDNGSNDENILKELKADNRVTILTSGKNSGYMGGARLALAKYLQSNGSIPDFVVLSNTDITFNTKNDIEKLFTEAPDDADVIGPCITDSFYQSSLNPFYEKRISKTTLQNLVTVFSFYPFYIFYQVASLIKKRFGKRFTKNIKPGRYVYAIHGAALFLKKTFFEKGGSFNYDSFLFGEEIFIAETALKFSMKIFYYENVTIIHHEHATTGTFKKPIFVKWMKESLLHLLNKFFND